MSEPTDKVTLSRDDRERLGSIAGCLRRAASENVIHPDFAERDARFLVELAGRAALEGEGDWDATNCVRLCDPCEEEIGAMAGADKCDRACAACGEEDAPNIYPALGLTQPSTPEPTGEDGTVDFTDRPLKIGMPDDSEAVVLGYIVRRDDGALDLMQREGHEVDASEIIAVLPSPPETTKGDEDLEPYSSVPWPEVFLVRRPGAFPHQHTDNAALAAAYVRKDAELHGEAPASETRRYIPAPGDQRVEPGVVLIARCAEHGPYPAGLHGARDTCFDCGGPVEQVPMLPVEAVADEFERRATANVERAGSCDRYARENPGASNADAARKDAVAHREAAGIWREAAKHVKRTDLPEGEGE